jgi:hypothetical protein
MRSAAKQIVRRLLITATTTDKASNENEVVSIKSGCYNVTMLSG